MFNTGLKCLENKTAKNFTTDCGIHVRSFINPFFRWILEKNTKGEIVLEHYPILDEGPYIFCSSHSHIEDIISDLAILDRNAYVLIGTTDQLEHNPQMYAAWINGLIYVDRDSAESRHESLKMMEYLLRNRVSVLLFPEGSYNNSANLLVKQFFPGFYKLAIATHAKVVPISNFLAPDSKIYINVGNPIAVDNMSKKEALETLRDRIAEMRFLQIENHTKETKRSELGSDPMRDFMESRRREYFKVKWSSYEAWEQELTSYRGVDPSPTFDEVWGFLDKIDLNDATSEKLAYYLPLLEEYKRAKTLARRYDFGNYMKENWKNK